MSAEQRTILIVDDREENRYTIGHALTRAGFTVAEASTGQLALEMARGLPDVIVLDIRLPDMLGYDVCRRLRANPLTSHIPVLQLSATFTTTESKLYALESGAEAYLQLPADPLILVATVRSLIRLHDAEKQAQLVARQWSATFDALSEGVALIDRGRLKRCNRAMTELLGTSYGELEDSTFDELLGRYFGLQPSAFVHRQGVDVQVRSRFFHLSVAPLPENDDTPGEILIVADVTPRKQAEQALLLNERLAATGRMAHTIAHEINNPLEAITNLIYLAQHSDGLPEEAREYLETAAQEVERTSLITRQILSFNREANSPKEVPIVELVEDVLAFTARLDSGNKVSLVVAGDRTLRVVGYPARLRQVFANLIRNAMEASPPSSVLTVRIRQTVISPRRENAVRVTIADQGSGISAENRSRIFDAFFTTKEQRGSGIGLWLSLAVVQEHGGLIQIRSCTRPERHGTILSVLLPMANTIDAKAATVPSQGRDQALQ